MHPNFNHLNLTHCVDYAFIPFKSGIFETNISPLLDVDSSESEYIVDEKTGTTVTFITEKDRKEKNIRRYKNWAYAYRNIQVSLNELLSHLQRNNLEQPPPLSKRIAHKTPTELEDCVEILKKGLSQIQNAKFLEQKLTKMLLERFIDDAQSFKTDLEYEIDINPSGIENYLLGNF